MDKIKITVVLLIMAVACVCTEAAPSHKNHKGELTGTVKSEDGAPLEYSNIYLKGTRFSTVADEKGEYKLTVPPGDYVAVFSYVGFRQEERKLHIKPHDNIRLDISLVPEQLQEVVVTGSAIEKVRNSAFNATAINTTDLENTTKTLSEALSKAPGMKIRESGGVGSDMAVTMDGFSGKHVKVFIDGVPQEGVGSSFGLNNIPVNYAERIEVYRGVVPVGFGADAIGGVINIVTPRHKRKWFVEASYSYGSFNTHKSYINFGQTFENGFRYEVNAFQNYSDNDYWVDSPVENFETGAINRKLKEHVRRFNDTYHNEAAVAKVGFVDKPWADRLFVGLNYSHMYKEIQTGVRQEIVYGKKHRHGHSLMPSVEYGKRNLFVKGLDVSLSGNYNNDITENVDTASMKYNWRGESVPNNTLGEQSYQDSKSHNNNWTGSFTGTYRLGDNNTFVVNDVFNSFNRWNENLLTTPPSREEYGKVTTKNILGLSWRYILDSRFNVSLFGKYYHQYVSGPVATTSAQDVFELTSRSVNTFGYGVAGTYFLPWGFQFKASYERAVRLPTIEEMFGDEDLEKGDIGLKPESSHNVNLNLSYDATFGLSNIYVEGGFVYRDTRDYIQRNILALSGGLSAATYVNYGKVDTKGFSVSARYSFSDWVSVGGNFTQMNVRDNMPTAQGTTAANLTYRERVSNLPYMFADSDVNFYWHGLGKKGNVLSVTYDNQYTHSFSYYAANIGANKEDYIVPDQFAHNLSLTYSIGNGRYNFSFECRNFTDARLYDNFSLQKSGRAFYGKIRIYFGN